MAIVISAVFTYFSNVKRKLLRDTVSDNNDNGPSRKEAWSMDASEIERRTKDTIGSIGDNKTIVNRLADFNGERSVADTLGLNDIDSASRLRTSSVDESYVNISDARIENSTKDDKMPMMHEMKNMIEENRKHMNIAIEDNREDLVGMIKKIQVEIERLSEKDKALCKKVKKILGYEMKI